MGRERGIKCREGARGMGRERDRKSERERDLWVEREG